MGGGIVKKQIFTKEINSQIIKVDFEKQKFIYPIPEKNIKRNTTTNFEQNENFVVFACVYFLLQKGYLAKNIILEPAYKLGHESKVGGFADILVQDSNDAPYLLIECKTPQDNDKNEFEKEFKQMKNDGGQLFSYFQQDKNVKFLCLYTCDFLDSKFIYYNHILNMQYDDYKQAKNVNESFDIWKKYDYISDTKGIFEKEFAPYKIIESAKTFNDLQEFSDDSTYHKFATILRKHNVSGKENAFDKLVNLFLCKIYDESCNKQNLQFHYLGRLADSYEKHQDRLMNLYKHAMDKFLKEKIVYVSDEEVENAFSYKKMQKTKQEVKDLIKSLKFYTNNDFAFLEVHNEELFLKNALVLKEVVNIFENYKLTQNKTHQFLGNLFELFLKAGIRQDEGQFFTPIQICEFMIYSLPLENLLKTKIPKMIDYSCGAGHFLNTYASFIKNYIKDTQLKEYYSNIFGIEKEYRLSKISKVASAMYGQNEINIIYADTLDSQNQKFEQIQNFSFDILLANPPYSVKGFLDTLPKSVRESYELYSSSISADTNNAIECFFFEKATWLLAPDSICAIILPSSFLNKDGIYQNTRKILLRNFKIIAIVELGSSTFGATGTNTIVLFLQKSKIYENTKSKTKNINSLSFDDLLERLEDENLSDNSDYDKNNFLRDYCAYMNIQETILKNLLDFKYCDEFYEIFKDEYKEFQNSKEYKKLCKKSDSKDLEKKSFVDFLRQRQAEKLLFFAHLRDDEVLIIKSPTENKEQKNFLGYEWSNRKGDEGLKELNSPYTTPLFDRSNPNNPNKLNFLIKCAFLNQSYEIPNDLAKYAFKAKLNDLIDFQKPNFNLAISLNPQSSLQASSKQSIFENCKYELVRLGEIIFENPKSKIKVVEAQKNQSGKYPFFTSGKNIYTYNSFLVKEKNIYLSTGGNALVQFYNGECAYSTDTYSIKSNDENKLITKFLFFILENLTNHINEHLFRGMGLKHLQKQDFKNLTIPKPPLEVQKQIVLECEKVEKQYNTIRMSVEKYQELIKAVLAKAGIISATNGGQNLDSEIFAIFENLESLFASILSILQTSSQDDFISSSQGVEHAKAISSIFDLSTLKSAIATLPTAQKWDTAKVENILQNILGNKTKIKESEIQQNGKYPVITQESDNFIAGYSNTENPITDLPIIIFGDHTCSLKYVDFKFVRGADGTQLLKFDKNKYIAKFMFFVLQNLKIENQERYERHFKYLKNVTIPLPPLEVQNKIVSVIQIIESKIALAKQSQKALENANAKILEKYLN